MKESIRPRQAGESRQNDGAFELCFELSIDQWKNPGTSHENRTKNTGRYISYEYSVHIQSNHEKKHV
jgi:hypothetical protein